MRKLIAMFTVFGLAAIVAAYVGHAPVANDAPDTLNGLFLPLDAAAVGLTGIAGRDAAVLTLLGAGLVLGMLVGLFSTERADADEVDLGPGPVWHPEPHSQDDRIARLRRRAGAEVVERPTGHPAFAEPDAPESAPADAGGLPPGPVVLARKSRTGDGDWTNSASWLGGLPRLAGADWPRDAQGRPLPFAAQIDLAELARTCPLNPLPHNGSLAFFLGTGAVLSVPPGDHEFTDPPDGLLPAYEEGGAPLPVVPTRLSRYLFPFWPVEPVALTLSKDAPDDDVDPAAAQGAIARIVRERFGEPVASLAEAGDETLWWYGVFHLADQLHEALDSADRIVAADAPLDDQTGQEAAALSAMVEAMDGFISNRDPWEPLTAEERDLVVEILDEINRRHGRLVRHVLPDSLAPLRAICIRAMASGAPEAFAALPDEVRARIARGRRVPPGRQHQMLGPDDGRHDGDLLLLQLASDDLMEWRWGGGGVFRFRIGRPEAAAGDWACARLTFEGA
ncbi:hypothetical protein GCM10011494_14290 [Novosphingobium endophyticum]|uniref:DUF1963 domain-containing protein n=1 Tax=Novosphingobium endophyticum TaxID=1955250 RepID=A0A916TRX1_9SPHN|nr:DUF1963 domain-containing protein [Novosphingobium endophyticum]GGB96965.1 hypothetical protein GCM10011494_14290 [Novosphingobium endophyticum]